MAVAISSQIKLKFITSESILLLVKGLKGPLKGCAMQSHDHQWARLSARLMLLSLEKAPWNVAGKLAIDVADSWHPPSA